ncbi:MAG: response regulator transcription factor [Alphaproteobacteria bacterium]
MKLLIADDHTLFRDALVQYIQRANPECKVTLAGDFYEALNILKKNPDHDLVILDLRMPGMNGMQGFETLKEKFPKLRVALMSGVAEEEDVEKAIEIGAVGYFPKTMSGRSLLGAIRQVIEGDKYIPTGSSAAYMPSYYTDRTGTENGENKATHANKPDFTPRESEVLSYLLDGASNKDIARALNLQVVTVKLHVRGICRKLDAKNRTQAALRAKSFGIMPVTLEQMAKASSSQGEDKSKMPQ